MTDRDGGRAGARQPQRQQDTWERVLNARKGSEVVFLLLAAGVKIPGDEARAVGGYDLAKRLSQELSDPPAQEELDLLVSYVGRFVAGREATDDGKDPEKVERSTWTLLYRLTELHESQRENDKRARFVTDVTNKADQIYNAANEVRRQIEEELLGRNRGGDTSLRNFLLLDEGAEFLGHFLGIRDRQVDWQELAREFAAPSDETRERAKDARKRVLIGTGAILGFWLVVGLGLEGLQWQGLLLGIALGVIFVAIVAVALMRLVKRFVRRAAPFIFEDEWYKRTVEEMRIEMNALGIRNTSEIIEYNLLLPVQRATDAGLVPERLGYWLHRSKINDFVTNTVNRHPDLDSRNEAAWKALKLRTSNRGVGGWLERHGM